MKVASDTHARLTLEDTPWGVGLVISLAILVALAWGLSRLWAGDSAGAVMAVLVLALCAAAFAAFVRRVIVIFDRGAGRVVVRVASVFGTKEEGAALADVLRAELDTRPARRSRDRDTHRATLRLRAGGVLALSQVFISGTSADTVVGQINGWLGR